MSHILKTCLLLIMRTLIFKTKGVHVWHNDFYGVHIITEVPDDCYDIKIKGQN